MSMLAGRCILTCSAGVARLIVPVAIATLCADCRGECRRLRAMPPHGVMMSDPYLQPSSYVREGGDGNR